MDPMHAGCTQYVIPEQHNLREFVLNSRHPDPRRVWKVGPGSHLLTPLPGDPRECRDPGESSQTLILDNPSITFSPFPRKMPP